MTDREKSATAKRYLTRSIGSHRYIKALERRLASFTFANITRYENDGTKRTELLENAQESRMLEYSELRRLIDETKAKIETADVETLRTINEIESNLQKTILVERYINLASWESIAKRVDYSAAHVQRLHGQALLALYKVLRSEGKE